MSDETTPLTQEQKVEAVKATLTQQLNGIYGQLVSFIKNLPLNEDIKKFAIMNLDQGIMWTGQGIKALSFEVPNQPAGEVSNETSEESNEKSSEEVSQENASEENAIQENEVSEPAPAAE